MKRLLLIGTWLLLSAFGPAPRIFDPLAAPGAPPPSGPRTLLVFMDGTRNDPGSNTNVYKLFRAVVTDRATTGRVDTAAFYIEGVGTGADIAGAVAGVGFAQRVQQAYAWLLRTWRPGDHIAIFGFSRGAYSGRAVAGMLEYGGLPAQPIADRDRSVAMASSLFFAIKERKASAARRLQKAREVAANKGYPVLTPHIPVTFMGLWDTVEALGDPFDGANLYDLPNTRYGDQLCNVEHAAHAISADDNRNRTYRPVLLTGGHLLADCPGGAGNGVIDTRVDEVWFTGAHSDVGGSEAGSYRQRQLGGVTLNWMLSRATALVLLPGAAPFPARPLDSSGDGYRSAPIGGRLARTLAIRQRMTDGLYRSGHVVIHQSVVDNLAARRRAPYELDWAGQFPECFQSSGTTALYRNGPGCRIDIAQ